MYGVHRLDWSVTWVWLHLAIASGPATIHATIHKAMPNASASIDAMITTPLPLLSAPESAVNNAPVVFENTSFWQGDKGQSIKTLLEDWTARANVDLVWESERDYTLSNNVLINDNFKNALMMVLSDGLAEDTAPSLTLMETPGGSTSATLVIKDQG